MNGKTRVCGVIGCPVEHSMSPQMHNFYAERTGLNLAYVPFRVEPQAVGDAVKGAYALNLLGLNVTVPHKQRVMEYLVEIDEDARAIGAVNTLVRMEGGYKGYNTDAAGLKRAMDRAVIAIRGQRCLLLGAGGAAKAAAYLLAREGADEVFLLNRNLERAAQLADCVNGLTGRDVIRPMALADYGRLPGTGRDFLCIQSTSVGMHPDTDRAVIEDEAFYQRIHTGVDIVYTPSETKFMRLVRASGGSAVGGLDMLLYQGIIAYELWNPGTVVDEETATIARQMLLDQLEVGRRKSVVLIGFMGAGKTSVADRYAADYGLTVVDTDQRIEEMAGMPIKDIFASRGEEAFRALETEMLRALFKENEPRVISVGGGLPLRAENRELLKQLGTVVLLDVSVDTVLERLGGDVSSRPMLRGDDVRGRVEELMAFRRPVYRETCHRTVDVNGRTVEEIAAEIHKICQ